MPAKHKPPPGVPLRPPSALLEPLSWALHYKLTPLGQYIFLGLLFAVFSSVASIQIPVFHIACGLIALFAVAWLAGIVWRPVVEIELSIPEKTTAGQTLRGCMRLKNLGFPRARALVVVAKGPTLVGLEISSPATLEEADRGNVARLEFSLRPSQRGLYRLPEFLPCTVFPFDLMRTPLRIARRKGLAPTALLALPRFHALSAVDIPIGRRYQPGGIALTSDVGESPEFIGNRDYRPGDPLRRLDSRSWARLARPVVREFQEEYYSRVALVLDTYVAKKRKASQTGFPELEAAVSMAAAIADAMARGEHIIDLFAAGPELYVFRSGRHTAHFENVLEILAGVDACQDNPFERVTPALAEELTRISAVICVVLDWDEARENMVRTAAEAGCAVKCLLIREAEPSNDFASADKWAESVHQLTPEQVRRGALERI